MSHHCISKKLRFGAVWDGGVIGPDFLGDDQDWRVIVNGNRYRSMCWPELNDIYLDHMWLQQDGATSHKANVTINLLKIKFGECVISRKAQSIGRRAIRSCDLTLLDYFLWGYVNCMVYANKSVTIDELRTNIEREITAASVELSVENWVQRLDFCKRTHR